MADTPNTSLWFPRNDQTHKQHFVMEETKAQEAAKEIIGCHCHSMSMASTQATGT